MSNYTIIVGGIALVLFAAIAIGTVRRNRWSLNFGPPNCPNCGTPVPRFRRPNSARQAAWGGWTCANCGTEMDQWGRAIAAKGD